MFGAFFISNKKEVKNNLYKRVPGSEKESNDR